MKSKEFIKFCEQRKKEIYANPDSILREYDDFMAMNGIFHGHDPMAFSARIKGKKELCEGILEFYKKAKLENEKFSCLQDLFDAGYDKNMMVELILEVFYSNKENLHLWNYGDLLYKIKNYQYLLQYIELIQDKSYGSDRQMIVLLVGKSKKEEVIPILKELLNDPDVYGHALEALTNFSGEDIETIMMQYTDYKVTWVRNTAKKYLKKKGK